MCLGIPGRIIEIYDQNGLSMGTIDFDGVTREVCLAYIPEAEIGDYAIIHVGFAINLLSEEEAKVTLETLREFFDLQEELGPDMPPLPGSVELS